MQKICDDEIARTYAEQDLKEYLSQTLARQAQRGGQLVSMKPAVKKILIWWVMILWNYVQKTNT